MKTENFNDSVLLNNFIAGDQESIETLIIRHRRRVYNYILMMVKDSAIAEDIFQETFIKVIATIQKGKYNDNGKFVSWVLRIAHNMVIDHFRSNKNIMISNDRAGYDVISSNGISESNIEDKIIDDQIASQVRDLIDTLPVEQREVVVMRHYMDLSFKEIAEQTGVSINTALGRMRYALINLRKLVDEKQLSLI